MLNMNTNDRSSGLLPEDVTALLGDSDLVRKVLKAVERTLLAESLPNFVTASGSYRPQMLLSLLACAHAMGIYGSQNVEEAIRQRKALDYLCAGATPDARTLRMFRRQNHVLLKQILHSLLANIWTARLPAEATGARSYLEGRLTFWAAPLRPDWDMEAERRIRLAIMSDSISADE